VLGEISQALKDNPAWKIKIDGHTDNVGGDAYNLRLSQRRAEAVKQALITQYGISPDRMTPEGFGASRPKAPNTTVEGRALNRRVELVRQ
jgi:OmpA-OmpF porin, OOP family